jgi:hypothetical protein
VYAAPALLCPATMAVGFSPDFSPEFGEKAWTRGFR